MKSPFHKVLSASVLAVFLAGTALAANTTAKFKVTGMVCSACQARIQKALTKTEGVANATVDLNSQSATVIFDEAKVKPEQIIKIIEKEGFKAQLEKKS
jgi:P-type Cu+ transporter